MGIKPLSNRHLFSGGFFWAYRAKPVTENPGEFTPAGVVKETAGKTTAETSTNKAKV
jgi:hypothetical protein